VIRRFSPKKYYSNVLFCKSQTFLGSSSDPGNLRNFRMEERIVTAELLDLKKYYFETRHYT